MNTSYFYICSAFLLFLLSSCTPGVWVTPGTLPGQPTPPPSTPEIPQQTVTSPAQKEIRETQDQLNQNTGVNSPSNTMQPPAPPAKKTYPTARKIDGRPGWVFNPYNNNNVFIGDIPSGKLVRDPNDSNPEHKFRVP